MARNTLGDEAILPPLRMLLRRETQPVHDRLHRHDGFSGVKAGTITLTDYRKLLRRLHGFYVTFEAEAGLDGDRTTWLEDDLAVLEGGAPAPGPAWPRAVIPRLDTALRRLGARYVVEGSALGGRELARGLDRLLGREVTQGRRFFIGRGPDTGEAWRSYLACLAVAPAEAAAREEIAGAAMEIFLVFEHWLDGWRKMAHG